jgi:hypothetical protein
MTITIKSDSPITIIGIRRKRRAYVMVAGKHQFFPKRELETIEYSIEEAYQGLYQQIRGYLGKPRRGQPVTPPSGELTYARYGLWHYVKKSKQDQEPYTTLHRAGVNLRGLVRVLLFKRFESSVHAFRETLGRLLRMQKTFLAALAQGFVPAGELRQSSMNRTTTNSQTCSTPSAMFPAGTVSRISTLNGFANTSNTTMRCWEECWSSSSQSPRKRTRS